MHCTAGLLFLYITHFNIHCRHFKHIDYIRDNQNYTQKYPIIPFNTSHLHIERGRRGDEPIWAVFFFVSQLWLQCYAHTFCAHLLFIVTCFCYYYDYCAVGWRDCAVSIWENIVGNWIVSAVSFSHLMRIIKPSRSTYSRSYVEGNAIYLWLLYKLHIYYIEIYIYMYILSMYIVYIPP